MKIITSSQQIEIFVILGLVTFLLANMLSMFSIEIKNATLASMIEISYPFFIAIFSFALFRENNLNIGTTVGGFLVFLGIFIIYIFNK